METTTENTNEVTLEQILELLPKKVSLHYVDYRDSLDEHTETLQKCISAGNMDALHDKIFDWYTDDFYGYDEVIKELRSDLEKEFEFDEDELDGIMEQYEDEIRDAIYDRDDSNVVKDLLRNTSDQTMFYDTGHYVESGYGESEAHYRLERIRIKKLLSIVDSTQDKHIDELIDNATYGGNLFIYFYEDVEDFIKITDDINVIHFDGNVSIAIVNNVNGSGHSTEIAHSFSLPFNRSNVFIDKEVKYSFTFDVCGMSSNWCSGTGVHFLKETDPGEINNSTITDHINQQAQYDKVFQEGGCTFGDTNIRRHRDTPYYNEPMYCRNQCAKCGQVWID